MFHQCWWSLGICRRRTTSSSSLRKVGVPGRPRLWRKQWIISLRLEWPAVLVGGATDMGYRPQFQHKNGRPQGPAEALGLGNGGGGLTVINSLSSLGLSKIGRASWGKRG